MIQSEVGKKSLKSEKRIVSGIKKLDIMRFIVGTYFIFSWNWVFVQPHDLLCKKIEDRIENHFDDLNHISYSNS